jgi:hypothetical protein
VSVTDNGKARGQSDRLRIVVLGYIVRGPVGGMAWSDLHYLLALVDLGHDVYFVEDSGDSPWCCYDPSRNTTDTDPTYGLGFARSIFERVGLDDRWAYYDAHTCRWIGPCADRIDGICATADLLLDLGGVSSLRPWLLDIPIRAFVDKDPLFTQVGHINDPSKTKQAAHYTVFFSFGENVARQCCAIPNDGLPWQPTRHPIFMDYWPVMPGQAKGKLTTVMLWDSYRPVEYQGVRYGTKSVSFAPLLDLPGSAGPIFELAVGGPTAPRDLLASKGWKVRDPLKVASDPWTYRGYIQQSKAEFTVAKHGYVVSRSGWFSERSAAYLANGRPVVTQETGFSEWLEAGSGVVPFTTPEEAIAAIEDLNRRYDHHCRRAREIAVEYFDARKVLPHLSPLRPLAKSQRHVLGPVRF